VRPSRFVAQSKHFKGTNGEVVSIWSPLDRSDNVVIWQTAVKLSSVLVPDSVLAVLSSRDDHVVGWVPVSSQDDSVMSFPRYFLVSWEGRDNGDVLFRSVENRVILWRPAEAIDRFGALDKSRSNHTRL
jgi:hypothetical protein